MASPNLIQTLDQQSLESFQRELLEAGFRGSEGGRRWIGPTFERLREFTDAQTITIGIRDGWPYIQPDLTVEGLPPLEHVNERNVVCLWQTGDPSRQWETLRGWEDRIALWCDRQTEVFYRLDEVTDAHAYFDGEVSALARMDLSALPAASEDGARGKLRGRWRHNDTLLDLQLDKASGQDIKGNWFFRQTIAAPPRNLDELRDALTSTQASRLAQLIDLAKDGKPRVVLLVWDTSHMRNALVLYLDRHPESVVRRSIRGRGGLTPAARVRARPLEFAPSQSSSLQLRAGSDAERLAESSVVVFGAGAIGSHIVLLLAQCGLGSVTVIDGEPLRPGNVVRHVAGQEFVGFAKPEAVAAVVAQYASWTNVDVINASLWNPAQIRERVDTHDLVVDATGNAGFTDQLGHISLQSEGVLVTATLYRRGRVARICRQAPGDTPLHARNDEARYPRIPRPPEPEPTILEAGCSAPVNEAPPHFVVACAALATELIVDALPLPVTLPDEIIEIYRSLEREPFDKTGRRNSAA